MFLNCFDIFIFKIIFKIKNIIFIYFQKNHSLKNRPFNREPHVFFFKKNKAAEKVLFLVVVVAVSGETKPL
jgi:hypothetical protein